MYDVVVIGAGVVGSAVAYYLSQYNLKVAVLEKENDVSVKTSKANSGIIHAGYDAKENTLMAKFNVEGNKLTREICQKLDVKYKETGSLVVAFNDEQDKEIIKLYNRGLINGVPDMKILTKDEVIQKEPNINKEVTSALYAPTAFVIEPWDLALSLAENAVVNGTDLFLNNQVVAIKKQDNIFNITTDKDIYQAKNIFNCAGVDSDDVHNLIAKEEFKVEPFAGQYYLLDKENLVNHVVFQAPNKDTKGVLVAPTVHGNIIVGPDNIMSEDYSCKTTGEGLDFVKNQSVKSIPNINFANNIRNFTGLRAVSDQEDFIIKEDNEIKGYFDVAGIKSPGLSSAVAIGKYCVELLEKSYGDLSPKETIEYKRKNIRFNTLNSKQRAEVVQENKEYGQIICRCESVTLGEINDCLQAPIPPTTLDGIKRRTSAGMGRCQGGFCSVKVVEILANHYNKDLTEIALEKNNSKILISKIREDI